MYWKGQEILKTRLTRVILLIWLFSVHLKGLQWLPFIVQIPPSCARVELPVYNTSDYYVTWNWIEELQVCMSSLERISRTFKVKLCSNFISKSCILAFGSWEWQLEESKSHHSGWCEGERSSGNSAQTQKENGTSPPPTRPPHLFCWTCTNKTQQFSLLVLKEWVMGF